MTPINMTGGREVVLRQTFILQNDEKVSLQFSVGSVLWEVNVTAKDTFPSGQPELNWTIQAGDYLTQAATIFSITLLNWKGPDGIAYPKAQKAATLNDGKQIGFNIVCVDLLVAKQVTLEIYLGGTY